MILCPRDGMKRCFWILVTTCNSYCLNSRMWPRVRNLFKFSTLINMFLILLHHPLIEHEFHRSKNTWNFQKIPYTQISDIQGSIFFNYHFHIQYLRLYELNKSPTLFGAKLVNLSLFLTPSFETFLFISLC